MLSELRRAAPGCGAVCNHLARGQEVTVHGWAFGVHDGLLQDLQMSISSPEQLDTLYSKAIDRVWDTWNAPRSAGV